MKRSKQAFVLVFIFFYCGLGQAAGQTTSSAPRPDADCDFESDLCEWTQAHDDQFDWTRETGPTATSGTGPYGDHTLPDHSGYYVYIETSAPRRDGDKARLVSPTLLSGQYCLTFWYSMVGSSVGDLNVYVRDGGNITSVWTRTGNQSQEWLLGQVDISHWDGSFNIMLEATRGAYIEGDIAVDDISLTSQPCSSSPSTTPTNVNPCLSRPCQNGATCVAVNDVNVTCQCPPIAIGQWCETIHQPITTTQLDIKPSAFLSAVTQTVQLLCRPPPAHDISQLEKLEVLKLNAQSASRDPVASYVIGDSPVLEAAGKQMGASVSGFRDAVHPELSTLTVTIPRPQEGMEGTYMCEADTLDSSGLLHSFVSQATLQSLAQNNAVPTFYHTLLKELRSDLDALTSDLSTVQRSQTTVNNSDKDAQTQLSAIANEESRITRYANEITTHIDVTNQVNASLHSQVNALRQMTPESPVNFYAHLTSTYISPGINNNIVFNALGQHTGNDYSTSTGVFTTPINGTYYFRTGLTGQVGIQAYATLTVNDQPVASLHAIDDYSYNQASAVAVMPLSVGDKVRVVLKQGSRIYGVQNSNFITYFLGLLLW